nr:TPA_asm: hypothetical protein HUJ06_023550 [Nelumbo nucifera]
MLSDLTLSLQGMKKLVVGSPPSAPRDVQESSAGVDGGVCAICQEEFEDGNEVRITECGHNYHLNCICRWLVSEKQHYPICRVELLLHSTV